MLKATEMEKSREQVKDGKNTKLENERNDERQAYNIVEDIQDIQLVWFEHGQRMPEARISKLVMQWKPGRRKKYGRPKRS